MRLLLRAALLLFGFLVNSHHLPAQWTQTAGMLGGEIRTLVSVDDVLFAGTRDGLYRSRNFGELWELIAFPGKDVRYLSAHGSDIIASYGWLQGGDSLHGISRSNNEGNGWQDVSAGISMLGNEGYARGIASQGDSLLWMFIYNGINEGGAYTSTDGGRTWTATADLPGTDPVIAAVSSGDAVMVSTRGTIWRKDTPGAPWRAVHSSGNARDEWRLAKFGDLILTEGGFSMSRSIDGGATWSVISDHDTIMNRLIMFGDTLLGLPEGISKWIYYSLDSGNTWSPYHFSSDRLHGMAVAGERLFCYNSLGVFEISSGGKVKRRADAGMNASRVFVLTAIDGSLYASTQGVMLFRSIDSGASWSLFARNLPDSTAVTTQVGEIGGKILVGGRGMYLSGDSGRTWRTIEGDTTVIHGITRGGSNLFIWNAGGLVRVSKDSGMTWTPIPAIRRTVNVVYADPPTVIAVADRMIYRSADNGETWDSTHTTFQGATLQKYMVRLAGGTLLLTNYTELLRSTDNGVTWSSVVLPVKSNRVNHLAAHGGKAVVVTDQGVFESNGDGLVWLLMETTELGMVRAVAMMPGLVFAGTDGQGVWKQPIATSSVATPDPDDATAASELRISPNPMRGPAMMRFSTVRPGTVTVEIADLLGTVVASSMAGWFEAGSHRVPIDPGALPSGLYRVRLLCADGVRIAPLVIVR